MRRHWPFVALSLALVCAGPAGAYINGGFKSAGQERDYYRGLIPHPIDKTYYKPPDQGVAPPLPQPRYGDLFGAADAERRVTDTQAEKILRPYRDALTVAPRDPYPWSQCSKMRYVLGDYPHALTDAETAVSLDAKFGRAYLRRALARWKLKQAEAAVLGDLDRAIALDPDYLPAYFYRVLCSARPSDAALEALDRAARPERAYYETKAYAAFLREEHGRAVEYQRRAVALLSVWRLADPQDRALTRLTCYERTANRIRPVATVPPLSLQEIEGKIPDPRR